MKPDKNYWGNTKAKYQKAELQNGFETKAIRTGYTPGPDLSQSIPLFMTSSYHYESTEHAAELYTGQFAKEEGLIYSRIENPTTAILEKRIAALENGEAALATASGMAAIHLVLTELLKSGDHVVCAQEIYGGTSQLLKTTLLKFGIKTSFVDSTNEANFEQAIQKNTKLFILETPTNPTLNVIDLEKISAIAKDHKITTIVDNTVATPALTKPLDYGIDIVVHAATKYIDGQGRALGGLVVGKKDFIFQLMHVSLRNTGGCLSPFNAWLFIKGLETLKLRIDKHSENALKIANWLADHPKVKKVNYPFHPSHPKYAIAKKQMKGGSGLLSFELESYEAGKKLIDSVKLISHIGNLGNSESIIAHSASTSHQQLSEEERLKSGITPGFVRMSVGLESADDLIADLDQAIS
jgi:O-succinylhomoserine sulfhydrylase